MTPVKDKFIKLHTNTNIIFNNPPMYENELKIDEGFPIKDFTIDEAYEYAELMKQTFIKHWEAKQTDV